MAVQQHNTGLLTRAQSLLDRVVSPQSRSTFYTNTNSFAHDQPLLFSFLATLLLLTSTPLFLFTTFTLSTLAFSLITALLFSLFWVSVALLVLIPILFVAVSAAIGVWIWGVVSFVVLRWIYGILPFGVQGIAEVGTTNGAGGKKVVVVKGEGLRGDVKVENA